MHVLIWKILIGMLQRFIKKKKGRVIDNSYADLTEDEIEIIKFVLPFTMTSKERLISLIRAVRYLEQSKIEGDFVECGVWKGGSVMAMISVLKKLQSKERKIWLCDTFEGMTPPLVEDTKFDGTSAKSLLDSDINRTSNVWAISGLEEVKRNISDLKYPQNKINYIVGAVETTLPSLSIEAISLLRLDTDWYESTKVELEILFPKLVKGGVLIIDDYGHWKGCKKAVDEYFETLDQPIFLNRIDYTGRIFTKYW